MVSSKSLYGLYLVARLAYAEDLKEKVFYLKKMVALVYSHKLKHEDKKEAGEWKKKTIDTLAELEVELVQLEIDMGEIVDDIKNGKLMGMPTTFMEQIIRINQDIAQIEAETLDELNAVLGDVKPAEISVASDVVKHLGSKRVKEEEWENVPDI